jgi:aminoglycoside 3-N-acetyltransferase
MRFARQDLTRQLANLGLRRGHIVMVHASVRSLGFVYGGPDEVHLAVQDAIAPEGTMMMVVGCPDGCDEVGRGRLTPEEEADLLQNQPPFDPVSSRADRDVGTLAEFFRSYPGTVCSTAPARFAARGARADWLVRDQPWDFAFGHGSPLEKLVESDGKLLLLAPDHDTVTLMHYVEHVTDFPGKRIVRFRVPVVCNGVREWVACAEVNSDGDGAHANWPDRFFALIVDDFIACFEGTPECSRATIGEAGTILIHARALVRHAAPIMVKTATQGWSEQNLLARRR